MGLSMSREFTAVFEKHGRWYIAYVEEIPGVNTQGKTISEARENLKEALQLILEENRQLATKNRSQTTKREPITVEV
jgi:predicted RNase H-like HicB family nuclease